MFRSIKTQRGASLVEYGMVVALVAVAALAAISAVGREANNVVDNAANELDRAGDEIFTDPIGELNSQLTANSLVSWYDARDLTSSSTLWRSRVSDPLLPKLTIDGPEIVATPRSSWFSSNTNGGYSMVHSTNPPSWATHDETIIYVVKSRDYVSATTDSWNAIFNKFPSNGDRILVYPRINGRVNLYSNSSTVSPGVSTLSGTDWAAPGMRVRIDWDNGAGSTEWHVSNTDAVTDAEYNALMADPASANWTPEISKLVGTTPAIWPKPDGTGSEQYGSNGNFGALGEIDRILVVDELGNPVSDFYPDRDLNNEITITYTSPLGHTYRNRNVLISHFVNNPDSLGAVYSNRNLLRFDRVDDKLTNTEGYTFTNSYAILSDQSVVTIQPFDPAAPSFDAKERHALYAILSFENPLSPADQVAVLNHIKNG